MMIVIATLLFSGLCSLSSSVPRQFHVVKEQKTWTEAQQYCREEFTDLTTIEDMTENHKVKTLITRAGLQHAWIGLKNGNSPKWRWSLADRDFYRENETEFRNWDEDQPNEAYLEDCVFSRSSQGIWHDFLCHQEHPFICYDGRNLTQPYVLITGKKKWRDAQSYCRQHHTDLASVRNQSENEQINRVKGDKDASIGLFRDAWEWADGSRSSFRHWHTGEPNYRGLACAVISLSGQWVDDICSHHSNFICYKDKLVLVRENKTWKEALQHCRDQKMDLVSVRSEQIQQWVMMVLAKGASTAHVWLGLRHACGVGWFWVWGETVCYSNWATGEEQVQSCESVGAVKSGGDGSLWVSRPETDKLNFICTTDDL